MAFSHVRHANLHGGGAPTALTMREAPQPCEEAVVLGGAIRVLDEQRRVPNEASRSVLHYLRALGFCSRDFATPPPPIETAKIENATLVIRLLGPQTAWLPRMRMLGAVLVDLVMPSARATSSTPTDGIHPLPFFCADTDEHVCEISMPHMEALLRMAVMALHPRRDPASILMGRLSSIHDQATVRARRPRCPRCQ